MILLVFILDDHNWFKHPDNGTKDRNTAKNHPHRSLDSLLFFHSNVFPSPGTQHPFVIQSSVLPIARTFAFCLPKRHQLAKYFLHLFLVTCFASQTWICLVQAIDRTWRHSISFHRESVCRRNLISVGFNLFSVFSSFNVLCSRLFLLVARFWFLYTFKLRSLFWQH